MKSPPWQDNNTPAGALLNRANAISKLVVQINLIVGRRSTPSEARLELMRIVSIAQDRLEELRRDIATVTKSPPS